MSMTKFQAIYAMNYGIKVRHESFSPEEWVTGAAGKLVFECGATCTHEEFWALRRGPQWSDGWDIAWDHEMPFGQHLQAVTTRTVHELKTDSAVFQATASGRKDWEIRKNDRNFKVGDELHLKETVYTGEQVRAGAPLEYTGRALTRRVTFILHGPAYGLAEGWCIMSTVEA